MNLCLKPPDRNLPLHCTEPKKKWMDEEMVFICSRERERERKNEKDWEWEKERRREREIGRRKKETERKIKRKESWQDITIRLKGTIVKNWIEPPVSRRVRNWFYFGSNPICDSPSRTTAPIWALPIIRKLVHRCRGVVHDLTNARLRSSKDREHKLAFPTFLVLTAIITPLWGFVVEKLASIWHSYAKTDVGC